MDVFPLRPISIQAVQRSGQAAQEQIAESRLFAAEVLQLGDGGSVVLGVGRERIAATSQAGFEVGQKLLLRVRGFGASRVLELVSQELQGERGELVLHPQGLEENHPFLLLAQGQGLGELLGDLVQALESRGTRSPAQASELAHTLGQFAFAPGDSGPKLAEHIANSGLSHEARTLARAFDSLPRAVQASAAEELISAAFTALEEPANVASIRAALGEQLARLLTDTGALEQLHKIPHEAGDRAGPAGRALREWIGPALERATGTRIAANVRAQIVEQLLLARLSPRLAQAVLTALLGEQAALAIVLEPEAATKQERAAPDLKQWLSDAIDKLEPGPERAAVSAAFDSLEAEQFVALARASQGDGASWVLALRDGTGFVDARLVHRRLEEREGDEAPSRKRPSERAVLGLEFSRTGPVRADLGLDGNVLHVRLGVSRGDVAEHLNATLEGLRARLEVSGRSVQLSVGVRAADELRVPGPDIDAHLGDGRAAVDRYG